jgi:hypothetical protein
MAQEPRADASPARLLPAGASSASAPARVTDPDTSFTEVAVASSDGSASPAIKSAAAPCRRAAMSFSSRDGAPTGRPAVERERDLAAHTGVVTRTPSGRRARTRRRTTSAASVT